MSAPGLPAEGVADPADAYRRGLTAARREAIEALLSQRTRSVAEHLAGNWDEVVRAVSAATDAFIAENGFLLERTIADLLDEE